MNMAHGRSARVTHEHARTRYSSMSIPAIITLFDRHGGESYGEGVSQLAHALQTADLARSAGEPDPMIAAALLHDIGQLLDGIGGVATADDRDARHEEVGAQYLARWFPESVVAPIRLHVSAKRCLCARDPAYATALSGASQLSLRLQGGPFSGEECDAFLSRPFAREAIRLRRYDDRAKEADRPAPPLRSYRRILSALAR